MKDLSTEEKIKTAARTLFTNKGFAATRTRDIAESAGINLALLNYYFGSKEKLFGIIMQESVLQLFSVLSKVLNDEALSLSEKVERVVEQYIILFRSNPDLPFFIMNEVRHRPEVLAKRMGVKEVIVESHLFRQLKEKAGKRVNPFHFLLNILSLTVFPFIASPMFRIISEMTEQEYLKMMEERRKLIPFWIDTLLNADHSALKGN